MQMLVINHDEIYLKGKNQRDFVRVLLRNLHQKLEDFKPFLRYEGAHGGAYFIEIVRPLSDEQWERLKEKVRTTPGISSFYLARICPPVKENILALAFSMAQEVKDEFESFGVASQRIDKKVPFTSLDLNREIGAEVVTKLGKKVNLGNPDMWLRVKVRHDKVLVYHRLEKAVGGLPVGSSGKAISLLSGGIDSPVSTQMAMLRGLDIVAVHFHAVPMTSPKSIEKVKQLLVAIAKYHPVIKLYLIPIYDIQQAIIALNAPRMRLVLLRRMMIVLANKIAELEKAKVLVTGDALGQVATQTLENMNAIQTVSERMILRPLVALGKQEIVSRARVIGTYDISIIPHDDTCALFVPKRPLTRAKVEEVNEVYKQLEIEALCSAALKASEKLTLKRS